MAVRWGSQGARPGGRLRRTLRPTMKTGLPVVISMSLAVGAASQTPPPGETAAQGGGTVLAFTGARVLDRPGVSPAIENAVIVVRDGRVASIGPAASTR